MKHIQNEKNSLQKINSTSTELLYEYCRDINNWPHRWEIVEEDVAIGQSITNEFKSFLVALIQKGRAKKTVKNHASYLWVLGGELIRALNQDESERKLAARSLILKHIDASGGPYWRHAYDELEHDRYDAVCRQLFKFMVEKSK